MNLKYLSLIVPVAILGVSATFSNGIIKAQSQISDPPPLPETSTPTPFQIPNLSPAERLNDWAKNSPNEPLPASISFRRRIPDAQFVQLMRRHNVQVRAVFMSVAGLSGTHRNGNGDEAAIVIAEARQKTAEMMQKDLDGSYRRFQDFEENHPRKKVLTQPGEKTHIDGARSLLRSVEESEVALSKAKGGHPLITGVEVVGSIDDIRELAAEPLVKEWEPALRFNGRVLVPTPQVEADELESYQDIADRVQAIQALPAAEVYSRIQNRARNVKSRG